MDSLTSLEVEKKWRKGNEKKSRMYQHRLLSMPHDEQRSFPFFLTAPLQYTVLVHHCRVAAASTKFTQGKQLAHALRCICSFFFLVTLSCSL
jgi:hypothetical protein